MDSIFEELDKKVIAPQKFWVAIMVSVFSISLSYVYHLLADLDYKEIVFIINMASAVVILSFFKKYLQNFRAGRAGYWVKWWIAVYVTLVVVPAAYDLLSKSDIPYRDKLSVYHVYFYAYFVILFADYYVTIRLGIILTKVSNDFIGLLRPLGIYNIFFMPLAAILGITANYSGYAKNMLAGNDLLFHMVLTTVSSVPSVLLIVIFYRAIRYRKMKENILGAPTGEPVRE